MPHVFDQNRASEAFSRPGIDPRVWVRYAIVEAVKIDRRGAKADVLMLPTGQPETVALGGALAPRGGCYVPVEIGQMVVVIVPMGDTNHGGVAIGTVWDGGQPAPDVVLEHPGDPAFVGTSGQTMRVLSQGTGSVVVSALGAGLVNLGDEGALAGVARLGDSVVVTMPIGSIMIPNPVPPFMPPLIPNPAPFPVSGVITSASVKVTSS